MIKVVSLSLIVSQMMLADIRTSPEHLLWAERLVRDLTPEANSYGSRPTVVQWRGVDGATRSLNRSNCSSFISALFRRAYGYGPEEMQRWLGLRSPKAVDYHGAIASSNRFHPVRALWMIQAGDLLASRQIRGSSDSTGHVMLARSHPQPLGSCQTSLCVYRLQVIDSSRTGHGPDDTRQGGGGVGMGMIQLRVDLKGQVQAYRWSEQAGSRWRTAAEEPLLIGRFCSQRC